MTMPATPTEQDAADAVLEGTGHQALAVDRFPTGNHHFVYAVYTDHDEWVVARLARPDQRKFLEGAVYWSNLLRPKGIPLPALLANGLEKSECPFPWLILERIPGADLGDIYDDLSHDDKKKLVKEIVRLQQIVAQLPPGPGYGYLTAYESKPPHAKWSETVKASLDRSRDRIRQAKIVEEVYVDMIEREMESIQSYFDSIKAVPFLHDTTTKNVIVHEKRLSGIVDVDTLCFGDPLLTVALTRTALWSEGKDLDYIEYWADLLQLHDKQKRALDFYTAQCVVDFMSECGQTFNRDKPEKVNAKWLAQLKTMHGELLTSLRCARR
jgi:aminoglycoside phosphotransferase (APT) family kinase protein